MRREVDLIAVREIVDSGNRLQSKHALRLQLDLTALYELPPSPEAGAPKHTKHVR